MTGRDHDFMASPARLASELLSTSDHVGPVVPTGSAISALRPLNAAGVAITGGFWLERLTTNRERSIGHGFDQLIRAGNLRNLRLAAGAAGEYEAIGKPTGLVFPFLDSDVYKWLEAVGWELGRGPDAELARAAEETIAAVSAAQRPDGYINSYVQVVAGGNAYQDLAWGHDLYCIGHLVQAAIAWHRALDDDRLLDVAVRAVDSVERELGPGGRDATDGHPEIEMALVELYRATGERRHLDLAARLVDLRGNGLLGPGRFGAEYWQDHLPVREAATVAGHAVRQLYLDCGAVDVATELGDAALLDAVQRRWQDMIATRTYLTGGLGSRHGDESFGDPYELPPDRAYAETCSAIASTMLAWRLLLATGDSAYADVIERTIYNGVLAGLSLDGTRFFYVNPLQRRTSRVAATPGDGERAPWFACACCPPNLMRILSSWPGYLATTNAAGVQVHQYADATIAAEPGAGPVRLTIETDYPWNGAVTVTVRETPLARWTLSLRVPAWCRAGSVAIRSGDEVQRREITGDGEAVAESRSWVPGDSIVLDLDVTARWTEPDPRIDAVRGTLALERGPLVYCIESADLPDGAALEDIELADEAQPSEVPCDDLGGAIIGLEISALRRGQGTSPWPYADGDGADGAGLADDDEAGTPLVVRAVPYFAWANRSVEAMRVWIPRGDLSGRRRRG
jgi:uncharacterized protein